MTVIGLERPSKTTETAR